MRRPALPVECSDRGASSARLFKNCPRLPSPAKILRLLRFHATFPDAASTARTETRPLRRSTACWAGFRAWISTYFVLAAHILDRTSNSNRRYVIAPTLNRGNERTNGLNATRLRFLARRTAVFVGGARALQLRLRTGAILGLIPTRAFQFMLEDRAAAICGACAGCGCAHARPPQAAPAGYHHQHLPPFRARVTPSIWIPINWQTMGISLTDAYNTLQTVLGGSNVNDFNQFGHTPGKCSSSRAEFRDQPSPWVDLDCE